MSITIGWWGIPLAITIISFVWAELKVRNEPRGGGYDFGRGITALMSGGAAVVVSLVAWLIYALAT